MVKWVLNVIKMYRFEVISGGIYNFSVQMNIIVLIDLVNNTKFDFDYPDSKGFGNYIIL